MSLENVFFIPESFVEDTIRAIIVLFVVMDPIGSLPITMGITQNLEKQQKRSLVKNTMITVIVLLLVFAFAGSEILSIFEIDLSSFMIAGGALLFVVAIEFLTHGEWRMGKTGEKQEPGIVPLAFPLLSGPGALTVVLISLGSSGGLVTLISIVTVSVITYITLLAAGPIHRLLGKRGSLIITRIFAIFLAAFAIQFIMNGIIDIFA